MRDFQPEEMKYVERAVHEAQQAEKEGNLPIGAVIVLDGEIIAASHNAIVKPVYNPGLHAEIQTIRAVPVELWPRAKDMTIYTTLEPCVMCMGTIVLHGIKRVVFGAYDKAGGSSVTLEHLPEYYRPEDKPQWIGPVAPQRCDPLYERVAELFPELPCG